MFRSAHFGRIFWVDDNDDFKSCPQNVDGTGDFNCSDYVEDWEDWEGVDYHLLFEIHKSSLYNAWNHSNSLTLKGA